MKVSLYGNEYLREELLPSMSMLLKSLAAHHITVAVEREFLSHLRARLPEAAQLEGFDVPQAPAPDMALSLGGDGTLLTTVMWLVGSNTPVLGINTGHLGYLTAGHLTDAPDIVSELARGQYAIEQRTLIQAHSDAVDFAHPYALNDIAILRKDTSSMIEMETRLNGVALTTYKGDGLVVCTPTGSTAYNMSAGGPILTPVTQCLVLTPVSPHSLNMRPLVVPDDAVVKVTTRSRSDCYQVSIDGEAFTCPAGSSVTIRRAPFTMPVVQRLGHNFATTLRKKLLWGTDRQ